MLSNIIMSDDDESDGCGKNVGRYYKNDSISRTSLIKYLNITS